MQTTFVATTLNEEKTIESLLLSILSQTVKPNEIIIADGGSSDNTLEILKKYEVKFTNPQLKYFVKKGNRSVGRNEAISKANGDIILLSDAGCLLDKNWVEEIIKPFSINNIDVVAGYYKGKWKSVFQKSLIPYVLVMPDKLNPASFLPAARSMALRKDTWKSLGGFDESLSHNEDYAFARKLKKFGYKIIFQKSAIVYWFPRSSLFEAYVMFFRFALGDIEAGIYRPKVLLILLRYFVFISFFIIYMVVRKELLIKLWLLSIVWYLCWSIYKNYGYVNKLKAFIYLPLLQLISDIAVMTGTVYGILKKLLLISR